jgi:hydroxymethylpyrimidine/phosphomethylpyrimidine kinase
MLHSTEVIEAVAEVLAEVPDVPVVIDPVMVAQSGADLLHPEAVRTLVRTILPHADLLTPNLPEAEKLAGREIPDIDAAVHAAEALLTLGVPAALLKGGHLTGDELTDLLVTEDGMERFTEQRIPTEQTHGTGCTLASAIAAGLAQGLTVRAAVGRARAYLRGALAHAPGFGRGQGPVNHAWAIPRFDG